MLTARKRVRGTLCVLFHTHVGKSSRYTCLDFILVCHTTEAKRIGYVNKAGFRFVKVIVLEDVSDILISDKVGVLSDALIFNGQRAFGILIKTADDVQKRGFTTSALAENGNHTLFREVKTDIVDNVNFIRASFVKELV